MNCFSELLKTKRYIPLISVFLIFPTFSDEIYTNNLKNQEFDHGDDLNLSQTLPVWLLTLEKEQGIAFLKEEQIHLNLKTAVGDGFEVNICSTSSNPDSSGCLSKRDEEISFIKKKQKKADFDKISIAKSELKADNSPGKGILKTSKIKEKLIETKRQLIEKEKQLVIKNKELIERENQISEREKELRVKEQEFQSLLEEQEKHFYSETVEEIELHSEITDLDEPQTRQFLFAQEDQQQKTQIKQQPPTPTSTAYPKKGDAEKCYSPFRIMHVGLRHTEARGVGYKKGYTTLEGFGIRDQDSTRMPFLDVRGHLFDDGKWAGNLGIGIRSYLSSINHVLGAYLYYDVRQAGHDLTAQQLSPGIELLASRMEYRINGYFPVGDKKTHKYGFQFDEFDGNSIFLKGNRKRVMMGGDAEVGAHLIESTKYDAYAGAGPYYFTTPHASAWGGKVRLLGRYKQYVSLEASYSYDHLFKNVVQGTIAFNFPFGNKIRKKEKNCTGQTNLALGRAAFAPYRFEIPVIKKVDIREKAINPATDQPWRVWFVDNTSSSSGTFESPFPTLVQAQNASSENDIIYVFPGDGTTQGMNAGITLQNFQKLWGSGNSHRLQTTKGKIKIPSFSSLSPSITNTAGNVVTLANGNDVSGFNILVASGSSGIFGDMGTNGATITDNFITGSGNHNGILFIGSGNFIVKDNLLLATGANTATGIYISPSNNGFTGIISNNNINDYSIGMATTHLPNFITNVEFNIEENVISNYFFGIFIGNYVDGNINFSRNTLVNNNGVESIYVVAENSSPTNYGKVSIEENNIIINSTIPRPAIFVRASGAGPSFLSIDIQDNQITTGSTAGATGISLIAFQGNTICASITDNLLTPASPTMTNYITITTTGTGVINVDDLFGNSNMTLNITGNVSLVAPGTCD